MFLVQLGACRIYVNNFVHMLDFCPGTQLELAIEVWPIKKYYKLLTIYTHIYVLISILFGY